MFNQNFEKKIDLTDDKLIFLASLFNWMNEVGSGVLKYRHHLHFWLLLLSYSYSRMPSRQPHLILKMLIFQQQFIHRAHQLILSNHLSTCVMKKAWDAKSWITRWPSMFYFGTCWSLVIDIMPGLTPMGLQLDDEMAQISVGTKVEARISEPDVTMWQVKEVHIGPSWGKSASRYKRQSHLNKIILRAKRRTQMTWNEGMSRPQASKRSDGARLIHWWEGKAIMRHHHHWRQDSIKYRWCIHFCGCSSQQWHRNIKN